MGRPSPPGGPPDAVVYEIDGTAVAPLNAAMVAHVASRSAGKIAPAGVELADGPRPLKAPHGPAPEARAARLEIRPAGKEVVARLSLYGRGSEPKPSQPPTNSTRRMASAQGTASSDAPGNSSPKPFGVYELRLPAAELPLILDDLASTGVYTATERPGGGARMSVGPYGVTRKEWTPEPRLDDLAERVLRHGTETTARPAVTSGRARISASAAP